MKQPKKIGRIKLVAYSRLRLFPSIVMFFTWSLVLAGDTSYWRDLINQLPHNVNSHKGGLCAVKKVTKPTPKEYFGPKAIKMIDQCIVDICGPQKQILDESQRLVKTHDPGKIFLARHRSSIEAAARNQALIDQKYVNSISRELEQNRPFSSLSTEEKVFSGLQFLANDSLSNEFIKKLSPAESSKLTRLLGKSNDLRRKYDLLGILEQAKLRTMSISKQKEDLSQLEKKYRTKFGQKPLWSDIHLQIESCRNALKVAEVAHSDVYISDATKVCAYVRVLLEAVDQPSSWERHLVDLGTLNKDFPILRRVLNSQKGLTELQMRADLESCAIKIGSRINDLPTDQKLAEFRKKEVAIRKQIVDKYLSKVSSGSATALEKLLGSLTVIMPASREAYEKAFIQKMKNFTKNDEDGLANSNYRATPYYFGSVQDWEGYVRDICDVELTPAFHDKYVPVYHEVNLSEMTNDDLVIDWVMAHEFFHSLDPSMTLIDLSEDSKDLIAGIKVCLFSFYGTTQFIQEDWADAGAFYLSSDQKINPICKFRDSAKVFEPTYDDEHPHVLARLLHAQVYKREGLPKSCTELTATYFPEFQLKKCFNFE